MPVNEYLMILRKLLIKDRAVIRESSRYFKTYLPLEYNDIWKFAHNNKMLVDVMIILPYTINTIDKVLMMNR